MLLGESPFLAQLHLDPPSSHKNRCELLHFSRYLEGLDT